MADPKPFELRPQVPIPEITDPADRFKCVPYGSVLLARACSSRQEMSAKPRDQRTMDYTYCVDCKDGLKVRQRLGLIAVETVVSETRTRRGPAPSGGRRGRRPAAAQKEHAPSEATRAAVAAQPTALPMRPPAGARLTHEVERPRLSRAMEDVPVAAPAPVLQAPPAPLPPPVQRETVPVKAPVPTPAPVVARALRATLDAVAPLPAPRAFVALPPPPPVVVNRPPPGTIRPRPAPAPPPPAPAFSPPQAPPQPPPPAPTVWDKIGELVKAEPPPDPIPEEPSIAAELLRIENGIYGINRRAGDLLMEVRALAARVAKSEAERAIVPRVEKSK